ncbi:MAG TPA: hypothetical protein VEA63_00530, partial [Opitutus sp.]|nr:hypothetical protein [Opitutus sp.]
MTIGATTYRDVEIRSINARTIILTHAGGMASVRLRDLPPELQQRFNYDPAADVEAKTVNPAPPPRKPAARSNASPNKNLSSAANPVAELLRQFGQPAIVQPRVDLRPKFFELELGVKNQGRRPSCAIFAIVSALEFQSAALTGSAEKFSEEYLTWATWRTVQRIPASSSSADLADTPADEDADLGFTLREVVAALRGYGIPLQSSMPNTFGRSIGAIADPPAVIVDEARRHQRVFVHQIPGRDNASRINNLVHTLNAGVPVVVGMSWP